MTAAQASAPTRLWRPGTSRALRFCVVFAGLLLAPAASGQVPMAQLEAKFTWEPQSRALFATFSFRHLIDDEIRRKLSRGLPTKILLTALVRREDGGQPVSTTYQSCTITWHVWEEMYRLEVSRPNFPTVTRHWTPTLNGVLRRCGEAQQLLIADSAQLPNGQTVYLDATLRINPISEELLGK
ncbi:MAG: hypothetical protein RJA70_2717, partial [Pseudomonadota bacterium]